MEINDADRKISLETEIAGPVVTRNLHQLLYLVNRVIEDFRKYVKC